MSGKRKSQVDWPISKLFNSSVGKTKVQETASKWKLDKTWLTAVIFLGEAMTEWEKKFFYEVKISAPDTENPIPITTASVFFTITSFRLHPNRRVQPCFVLEGERMFRYPEEGAEVKEAWVRRILLSKLRSLMPLVSPPPRLQAPESDPAPSSALSRLATATRVRPRRFVVPQ